MSQQPDPSLNNISENPPQLAINTNARNSLVFGVAGLILGVCSLLPGACALPILTAFGAWGALNFGYKAKREISIGNGNTTGNGMATAGIVLGWINALISLISAIFFIWMAAVVLLNAGTIGK